MQYQWFLPQNKHASKLIRSLFSPRGQLRGKEPLSSLALYPTLAASRFS
jgi:hypothetical protein